MPPSPFPTVREVCCDAIVYGCLMAAYAGLVLIVPFEIKRSSPYLTHAEAAEAGVLPLAMLLCGAGGVTAAALALLLVYMSKRARPAGPALARPEKARPGHDTARGPSCLCRAHARFGELYFAAEGQRLSHGFAVAAYAVLGTVFGTTFLLGLAGVVWGEE
ncbi:hypothetical protein ACP70R_005554 [Stipagrostis hirtigluma subsp. patula]